MRKVLYILIFIVGIASCSSDSSDILSMGEMEDILYDIHLSQHIMDEENYDRKVYTEITNREAIFRKYDITQAEWDSSYNYYCRHADKLHTIYQRLSERIRSEVLELGGDVSLDETTLSGDTINIWNSERNFILMQETPYNLHEFTVKADSTFKPGDVLTLQFDDKFIFQEGSRNLVAVLVVTLANDSVITNSCRASSDGKYTLSFSDHKRLGIKSIKGYFVLLRNNNEQVSTAFHLVSVENVRLILAHSRDAVEQTATPNPDEAKDSLKTDSVRNVKPVEIFDSPDDNSRIPPPHVHRGADMPPKRMVRLK